MSRFYCKEFQLFLFNQRSLLKLKKPAASLFLFRLDITIYVKRFEVYLVARSP
jgi:hypothetical protein